MNRLFLDNAIRMEIENVGFSVQSLLDKKDILELKTAFTHLKKMAKNSIKKEFWPSGRHEDPKVRNYAKTAIEKVVPKKLEKYLSLDEAKLIGGTYLIKPPSRKSALNPHQDSSHVDERFGYSIYAWIPLQNMTVWNGRFHYLPNSHTWGIHQRSLSVPWPLANHIKDLKKNMRPIAMNAGEVLFFHSALIHSSPPNYSFKTRIAVNYYIHPKTSPFCHFYKDEFTPQGKVEMFEVTPEFYYSEDFEKKPDQGKYKLIDVIDESTFELYQLKQKLNKDSVGC